MTRDVEAALGLEDRRAAGPLVDRSRGRAPFAMSTGEWLAHGQRPPGRAGRRERRSPEARYAALPGRWAGWRGCATRPTGSRRLSQHSGGMIVSRRPRDRLLPVLPAAMEGRQLCQWDKDSCADAGFLKIDLLGWGY